MPSPSPLFGAGENTLAQTKRYAPLQATGWAAKPHGEQPKSEIGPGRSSQLAVEQVRPRTMPSRGAATGLAWEACAAPTLIIG